MTCTRTLVVVGLLAGCKLETVQELPVFEEKPLLDTDVRLVPASEPLDEAKALVEAELRRQLSALTSPYLAGRRPGSEGATLTAGHLERTMLELGLSPAGVGGGWRQPVVVRIRAIDDARVELPGATPDAEPEILRHGEGMVVWRVEGSGGTWSHAHPVVDAGFGITAPDLAYDDYAAVDVKGKIVLVRDGVPAEGFEGDAAQDYGSRDYKLERARRVGAAGCLFATGLLRSDAAWQSQVEELRAPLIEASAEGSAHGPGIAVAGVLSADAEAKLRAWLAAASAAEGPSRAATVVGTTTERTVVDPNIIGRIPGHDRPEEVIVVLAH